MNECKSDQPYLVTRDDERKHGEFALSKEMKPPQPSRPRWPNPRQHLPNRPAMVAVDVPRRHPLVPGRCCQPNRPRFPNLPYSAARIRDCRETIRQPASRYMGPCAKLIADMPGTAKSSRSDGSGSPISASGPTRERRHWNPSATGLSGLVIPSTDRRLICLHSHGPHDQSRPARFNLEATV